MSEGGEPESTPEPEPGRAPITLSSARCGNHPDRDAAVTCGRCGTFLCSDCVEDFVAGAALCRECRPKVRDEGVLPWDESKTPWSFSKTFVFIVASPSRTFGELSDGKIPIGFALFVITTAWMIAFSGVADRAFETGQIDTASGRATTVAFLFALLLFFSVYYVLVSAGSAWLVAKLHRARVRLRTLLRVAAYTAPAFVVMFVVNVLTTGILGSMSLLAFLTVAFFAHARGKLGLRFGPALLVALGPSLVWVGHFAAIRALAEVLAG